MSIAPTEAPTTQPQAAPAPSPAAAQAPWSALDAIDDVGVQYATVYGRSNPAHNHLRLMAAVLTDAIRVLTKHRSPRRRREEMAWLTSRDRSRVFAFENVCEALGIDAVRLRAHVVARAIPVPALSRPARIAPRPRPIVPAAPLRRAG